MRREYDFKNARRGAISPQPPGKSRITIRLDDHIIEWFKRQVEDAGGGNYQTLINQALNDYVKEKHEPLEATLRRVVREELKRKARA